MDLKIISFLSVFMLLIYFLFILQRKNFSFTTRVFIGLILGIIFGVFLKQSTSIDFITNTQLTSILNFTNITGTGYTNLLKLIIQPLVLISILSAVINLDTTKNIGKIAGSIVTILVVTTMLSAGIGIASSTIFKLNASDFEIGDTELSQQESLLSREEKANEPIAVKILNMIPSNIFVDLSGQRDTSTLGIVIFAGIFGAAAKYLENKKKEQFLLFKNIINSLNSIILVMIDFILILTPFGVLAIMSKTIASTDYVAIFELGKFIIASYFGLLFIYILHLIIVSMVGLNPITFIKKTWPVLSFAFVSRSSASSIPINTEVQHNKLGVDDGIASMSATLGASIGQNGCAGLYPAMLAIMIAVSLGEPITLFFIIKLIFVIGVTSFGVAGVGGGATYASIIVLTSMGLPISLAAVLISIEPLIDMGRTLINVNDSMVAGVVTAKRNKLLDEKVYNN